MKKKRVRLVQYTAVTSIIVAIVVLVIFFGTHSNQQWIPGVKVGDEFIYDVKGFYNSDDPNATLFDEYLQLNMTEWFKVTVTDVDATKVSINTNWRFTNGTELDGIGYVTVDTGIFYPSEGFWAIYASNLKENDRLRPLGPDQSTINETITRDYATGITRETNRISQTYQFYDADDPSFNTTWTELRTTTFDRQTGMLVELRDLNVYTNPQQILTIVWTLKETNVWVVS